MERGVDHRLHLVGDHLEVLVALGAAPAQAYAGVFIFEAVGVLAAVLILSRVGVATFRTEVASFGTLAAEAMD